MFEHSPPSLLAVDQVKRRLDKTNQPTNQQTKKQQINKQTNQPTNHPTVTPQFLA